MDKIYVNGDSFSEGEVYLDSPVQCWPYQLIGSGFKVINDSLGGASNYRIFRTSVETISQNYNTIFCAIFSWTDWTRWEVPGELGYERQYLSTVTESVLIENFVNQIVTIENFCRATGVTYWHMNSFSSPDISCISNAVDRQRISKKLDRLDSRQWLIPFNSNIREWAQQNELEFATDGHLSATSNQALADFIKTKIFQ